MEYESKFEQLSKKSQGIVLDKTIDFEGCELTMRSMLQRHGNVQHVLGPELITDLITDETSVNKGGRLQVNEDYYTPRVLQISFGYSAATKCCICCKWNTVFKMI